MARSYTSKESASGWSRLGKARRNIIKRKRKTDIVQGALSAIGTVAAFGAGQAKKAETAWGEYEAGYKELGGEDFKRPGIGRGYFKGPEGDVTIGKTIYDREKIQKAGSFLSSEASAILDPEQRKQYLGRTVPGRDIPTLQKPAIIPSVSKVIPKDQSTQPVVRTPEEEAELEANRKIKEQQLAVRRKRGYLGTNWQADYENIMGENKQGFARGGDFITNGPQKILVGDNPGGRERVTITPLDSEDYKPKGYYGEARNWLEALYANNERRKKY